MVFIFFFQAEDGIRDYKVTGVQTCALPICGRQLTPAMLSFRSGVFEPEAPRSAAAKRFRCASAVVGPKLQRLPSRSKVSSPRSEERRVGEECRSRWSPDHLKKKKEL